MTAPSELGSSGAEDLVLHPVPLFEIQHLAD